MHRNIKKGGCTKIDIASEVTYPQSVKTGMLQI